MPRVTRTRIRSLAVALLRFHGFDIIGGTGRYHGATGKTIKHEEVPGGSDFVVRVHRR